MYDLLLKGGHVLDPAQDFNATADVAFLNGLVAAVQADIPAGAARDVRDVTGKLVVPGLIDLHTHVYWGGTSLGVDPEQVARQSGATTLVDAGSAGAGNIAGFRRHVIEPSPVRILSYLNISFPGIFAFSHAIMMGEASDLRLVDAGEAVSAARAHADIIVGIKVRVGRNAGGTSGIVPLEIALEAAEEVGLPLMVHIDFPPPSYSQVLERLRPGDILTHAFRPFPNSPLDGHGQVRRELHEAREREVIFDIGHGMGSLSFDTARAMLDQGFLPDVISSDVHILSIHGPAYDLTVTMSKFLCLGMPLSEVIRAGTWGPARAMSRENLGSLRPGAIGDATVLKLQDGEFDYHDATGALMRGKQRLRPQGIIIRGEWWSDDTSGSD
jgi:dihydroorotase